MLIAMLARLAAVVLVLGAVPATLFAAGQLPLPEREQGVVPYETRTLSAETQWREHVNAICAWEKKQAKTLVRAFRRARTRADVELLLQHAIRLGEQSSAIFGRLHPPLVYRREATTLRRVFRSERAALANLLDAFRVGNRAAFYSAAKRLVAADQRSTRLLTELGVDGCGVRPIAVPERERIRTI
jgi:hypothetical protein